MGLLDQARRKVYDFNYSGAETTRDIPLIGGTLLGLQKLTCDYIYDPLSGGDHVGCNGIDDVYHGLPNRFGIDLENQGQRER